MRTYRSLHITIAPTADRAMCAAFAPAHHLLELGNQRPVGAKREDQRLSSAQQELPVN